MKAKTKKKAALSSSIRPSRGNRTASAISVPEAPRAYAKGRCESGIPGLDEILDGGLPCQRLYVLQGEPGTGKTTMALQFLQEGVRQGQKALYITFSETHDELTTVAHSHGWDISKLHLIDLSAIEEQLSPNAHNTLFHPSEMELNQITELLIKKIDEIKPSRIVFDSVSEMRLLADNPLRYRRQILALKQTLASREATVLFLDDLTGNVHDLQIQSIAHGVIGLFRLNHEFGGERRRLRVLKLRGVRFVSGFHDFNISRGGAVVFPRLISSQHESAFRTGKLKSRIKALDSLVGGGLDYGTSNLFIGPAGTGKSSLALKYALCAAEQGKKVAYFTFDETITNMRQRSEAIGMNFQSAVKKGGFRVQKIDPAELSPGEFGGLIKNLVLEEDYAVIVVDSLNGYIQAMPQEQFLVLQLHELLAFLSNRGVVTILVLAQQGMIGTMHSPVDLTYLADTVLLTRFYESRGSIRRALSVVKKRTGYHENTIREFTTGKEGVQVGPILSGFEGILTGVPKFTGYDGSAEETEEAYGH